MRESEINAIVNYLRELASENSSSFGSNTTISLNQNRFIYRWFIENSSNPSCTHSILVDSFETATEIIHRFSNNPRKEIKKGLLNSSDIKLPQPLYLQFIKDIKY